jgi:hypothetical protein
MYFWNIEGLKTEMARQPLSDRQVLPYLIVTVGLFSLNGIFEWTPNFWDYLLGGWSFLLAILGTVYLYQQNGANQGNHFLQRYFAIGLVVGLRWIVAFYGAMISLSVLLPLFGMELNKETTWRESAVFAIAELLLYERIGHHISDLRHRSEAASLPEQS